MLPPKRPTGMEPGFSREANRRYREADALFKKAHAQLAHGDCEEAKRLLREAVGLYKNHPYAQELLELLELPTPGIEQYPIPCERMAAAAPVVSVQQPEPTRSRAAVGRPPFVPASPATQAILTPAIVQRAVRKNSSRWGRAGVLMVLAGLGVMMIVLSGLVFDTPSQLAARCRRAGWPETACTGVTRNVDWTPYTEVIDGVLMALVPAGCFPMGSADLHSDERPVHRVCFEKPFRIDVYEVTEWQFDVFEGQARHSTSGVRTGRPRVSISWSEANTFCQKRNARLPTEAEWEYSARGPDGLVYPWGNDFVEDNIAQNSSRGISWIGAYNLSGSIWDWVNDWYLDTYYDTLTNGVVNPQGPGLFALRGWDRVLRGGTRGGDWTTNYQHDLQAAGRAKESPEHTYPNVGFRCAISP